MKTQPTPQLHVGHLQDVIFKYADLKKMNRELLHALEDQVTWKMRDGSPCNCPAGKNEDEPKGYMPSEHSTACDSLRRAIANHRISDVSK